MATTRVNSLYIVVYMICKYVWGYEKRWGTWDSKAHESTVHIEILVSAFCASFCDHTKCSVLYMLVLFRRGRSVSCRN